MTLVTRHGGLDPAIHRRDGPVRARTLAAIDLHRNRRSNIHDKPKVLISDALSPAAVQIFKDRGIEVDFQPNLGKDKDKLAEIIGNLRRPRDPLRHQGHREDHREGRRG